MPQLKEQDRANLSLTSLLALYLELTVLTEKVREYVVGSTE